ncbi:MAG: LysR family transcriptional regulator [Clostridia bacterium]|nr:LysR family transcriptional regulator [Clostridia bacterium]
MTIRHLKVFISVCETGNMTRAAKLLHIAQPAVSYTISELERLSSAKLFERVNQKLVISDFGKELLPKARAAVASFEEFERLAKRGASEESVKIGASITIGKTIIPKILSEIKELYPEASPFVSINSTKTISDSVATGKLDFALVEGIVDFPLLSSHELSGDKLIAACGKDFPAPKKCSAKELAAFPLLLRESGGVSRELMENLFEKLSIPFSPFIESSSTDALLSAAKSGLGVVILPSALLEASITAGELREIEISDATLERKYYLIKHKAREFSKTAEKIYELFVRQE